MIVVGNCQQSEQFPFDGFGVADAAGSAIQVGEPRATLQPAHNLIERLSDSPGPRPRRDSAF